MLLAPLRSLLAMNLKLLSASAAFFAICSAFSNATFVDPSVPAEIVASCRNPMVKVSASCWETLGMDAYMLHWNRTTTTCKKHELWANCFMREAGNLEIDGFGCAQVGPNTCPKPQRELNALDGLAEMYYGAYSIWCEFC